MTKKEIIKKLSEMHREGDIQINGYTIYKYGPGIYEYCTSTFRRSATLFYTVDHIYNIDSHIEELLNDN